MRTARKWLNISASEAADLAKVNRNSWERYENDKTEPKPSALSVLLDRGINAQWLLTGEGSMMRGDEGVAPTAPAAPADAGRLDKKLVGRLTDKIVRTYKDLGMGIAIHEATEMAIDEHNRIVATVDDPADRMVCVGEYAADLRHRLLTQPAKTDTGKRQA
ncbi:hypothetical protein THS27_04395 [Thalassospira sp. MCCC 1A01428]|nr:hypothetical protein THS27_04395 [Thalassospira sp. MCCC 1A01428]